jgi:hypothetical protein
MQHPQPARPKLVAAIQSPSDVVHSWVTVHEPSSGPIFYVVFRDGSVARGSRTNSGQVEWSAYLTTPDYSAIFMENA